jgi:hypothetical protein
MPINLLSGARIATFTLRVPIRLAARLSSAEMRSWLADFLRQPHALPADPGSGEKRISLTLPPQLVRDAASFLSCSPSAALRRIAAERLGMSPDIAQGPASNASYPSRYLASSQAPARPVLGNPRTGFKAPYLPPTELHEGIPAVHPPENLIRIWPPAPASSGPNKKIPGSESLPGRSVRKIFALPMALSLIPALVFFGWHFLTSRSEGS